MLSNFLTIILVLVLLFLVYQFVLSKVFDEDVDADDEYEQFEENTSPGPAPLVGQKAPNLPDDRVIASSGPNPPAAQPPKGQVVVMPPEEPFDPFDEVHKSPHSGDDSRHPERMFRPAPEMNDTATAIGAGIASPISDGGQYSPEMVINGAEFMNGIFALDSAADSSEIGYSSF
jgi:hypothetical protein